MSESFGNFTRARLEAFSDGVIAVIITIMVLELKAPESAAPSALLGLWPSLAIYLVSFVFVAIYWINHHALLSGVKRTTAALIWANNCLLFFLSLIPFATAYVGNTGFAPLPTAIYAGLQLACGAAFFLVMTTIVAERSDDPAFVEESRAHLRKNTVALAAYFASVVVATFSPLAAIAILVAIAVSYVTPALMAHHKAEQPPVTPSLETRDLTIRFGGHVAVDHVSCAFRPGELTAIVGPNGAGKTTYFNLMSGQLRASDGAVLVEGEDVTSLSAPERTRRGLGRAFQLTNLFPRLSAGENVRLAVQARAGVHYDMLRPWRASVDLIVRADAVLESVGLMEKRDALAAALPHGDQRKLEVAMMMALEPRIYMFDEPTAGMSVDEVPVVLDLIARLKADKTKTILLVEHKMDVVRSLADRIIVLTNGRLAADGDPVTVIASPVVQEAYLGIAPERPQ